MLSAGSILTSPQTPLHLHNGEGKERGEGIKDI